MTIFGIKSCQVIEWCLWQVDNSRPSQHFSEGGAGMVGILGYVMGGVYVTNVNNQNRWGCPYLSKNASCTLVEKNYKISMTWKITFGQQQLQQSESRRFISFPDAPSIYSASPLLFSLLYRPGPIMSKLSGLWATICGKKCSTRVT